MRVTFYDKKTDTVYINSDLILPNTKGLPFKEHSKKTMAAFKLSYQERIKQFTPEQYKKEINEAITSHEGCKISEFSDL